MNKYAFKAYDISYPILFQIEKQRTFDSIECIDFQHVGSTAVPDLGGKGIIDIAISAQPRDFEKISITLQSLGYIFRKEHSTKERWFFLMDLLDSNEALRRYHIHLLDPNCSDWKDLIEFRDYLIDHPEKAKEYEKIKKDASQLANGNGSTYRRVKQPFIENAIHTN